MSAGVFWCHTAAPECVLFISSSSCSSWNNAPIGSPTDWHLLPPISPPLLPLHSHLGQVSELVGVEQELLQTAAVAVDLVGHVKQRAVALIDRFDVTVTPPQGDTVKHPPTGPAAVLGAQGSGLEWKDSGGGLLLSRLAPGGMSISSLTEFQTRTGE